MQAQRTIAATAMLLLLAACGGGGGGAKAPAGPTTLGFGPFEAVPPAAQLTPLATYAPRETFETTIAVTTGAAADEWTHVRADLVNAPGTAFGYSIRGDELQPWAFAPTPAGELAANRALSGTARWRGSMMGEDGPAFVGSDVYLTLDMATLAGALDFTSITAWDLLANINAPGVPWGDGELSYTVRVDGNRLVRTGGDTGTLRSGFVGRQHEAVAGTLVRDSLKAAFAGIR